jgi:catechol 2,3-dioxygenase-like lactoylglutathione lyase family enzyme
VGADGPDHPIATYAIAGSVVTLWQLPSGQTRVAEDNDFNTYVVVAMKDDLEPARRALIGKGVDVGQVRRSANNEFVWFHDPDGNRFELSRPLH